MDDFLIEDLSKIALLTKEISLASWTSFGASVISGIFLLMVVWWSSKNNPKGPLLQFLAVILLPMLVFLVATKVTISPIFKPCTEESQESIHCITSYEELFNSIEVMGDLKIEKMVQNLQVYQNQNKFYLSIPISVLITTLVWSILFPIFLLFFTQRRVIT
jgi:ABC-type transport system involved in cytochrome bd biosynthesis fused ATPase/permease subunit